MGIRKKVKTAVLGEGRDPQDPAIFHKLSLMAFLAWVGLGSDGLTSSCYGPSEIFLTLGSHTPLAIIVALAALVTIFIISYSYNQIIQLFPTGGGGYLVASKLLSPKVGMVSGSALMIDYVLTITVSTASGADALFSFMPLEWQSMKLPFALALVVLLMIMNMRGVKESVKPLIPIFIVFIVTHVFIILYGILTHLWDLPVVFNETTTELHKTTSALGIFGTLWLLTHAFSMGAGTFTGIEAVSNGMPILKDPKVHTARRTMMYMASSLGFMVVGLVFGYMIFNVGFVEGKTLNAVLFENATAGWDPTLASTFVVVTLISEGLLLFVAAQTGFLDGPRVLANMAQDRWVPARFASLSDRLVTQKGIVLMGVASFVLMLVSEGDVAFLVVLYSINVFVTFTLSQLGMVRHWWLVRREDKTWLKKFCINGIGLLLCSSVLVAVIIVKFDEGGWITILITGAVIALFSLFKHEYNRTGKMIKKLDSLLDEGLISLSMEISGTSEKKPVYDRIGRTAVLLVNGFSGIGVHSMLSIFRVFGDHFHNFVVMQVGVIDAETFKGREHLEELKAKNQADVQKYIDFLTKRGFYTEAFTSTGLDVVDEVMKLVPEIKARFPRSVFFGGQIVFPQDTFLTRLLHNYTVFSLQRKLYMQGMEFVILPIKMRTEA